MTATRVDPKVPNLADEAFRDQNAALLTDLGLAIIDDPSILDQIPDGAMLVLLPADADEAFVKRSVETGLKMLHRGHNVYFGTLPRANGAPPTGKRKIRSNATGPADRLVLDLRLAQTRAAVVWLERLGAGG